MQRYNNYSLVRRRVLAHYSNGNPKCACCGESMLEFLKLSRIPGVIIPHGNVTPHGSGFIRWIDNNYPEGYRVLCKNCAPAIEIDGKCPHGNL